MRTFNGITLQPFTGRLNAQPTHIKDTKFGGQPSLPPSILEVTLDWSTFGASSINPNVGVDVSMPVGGPRQTLDSIRSVRIDNTGNNVPVYVQFPDIPYVVVAPPNTVIWEPVETGQFTALIYGLGFTSGQIGITAVYFCNFSVAPLVNSELSSQSTLFKASPIITRGSTIYNQALGIPALGDQFQQLNLSCATAGVTAPLFGGVGPGFFYVTYIEVFANSFNTTSIGLNVQQVIESTGLSGILFNLQTQLDGPVAPATSKLLDMFCIARIACQLKLDASQNWRVRNIVGQGGNIGSGGFDYRFVWTQNPT
jgi:hypothetical protein